VSAALGRLDPTCLERALVEQAWLASLGTRLDVVIGVPEGRMDEGNPAHAWVDGRDTVSPSRYFEIYRLPPPPQRRRRG
jgi:hypothetical protein